MNAEVVVLTKRWITLPHALSFTLFVCSPALAQEAPSSKTISLWTNDALERLTSRPLANASEASSLEGSTPASNRESYRRAKDPKWYGRQLQPLREELAKIDTDLRTLMQARKSGKGATGAVALDQEPEGVTTEGQVTALQERRTQLLGRIDELEELARHNAIVPGELRVDYGPEQPATLSGRNGSSSRKAKELENSLAEEKEHLKHARKEAELLRRDQELKKEQVYSNPEQPWRRSKLPELVGISSRLAEEQAEIQEAEQKVAGLEDQLEDFGRTSPSETDADAAAGSESANDAQENEEKHEVYWRKQFAAIDYKIRIAQTELDILQRELNLGLIQYDPNPATAMKESITRRKINERRKAIEDKKKETAELKKQRDDLEDALRHAGGPAGWARE
ncbi:MAG TPA: hypothetical protein VEW05_08815 [Candidatus Polarisedimenticolia bacterium]|nr:hypothetical protein [Candidatus Polarisedimenticolia bacterium]